MAFTFAQKSSAVIHLGFAVDSWALGYIGGKMDQISSISSDSETRVISILTQMDTLETQMNSFTASNAGSQVKPDGNVYFQSQAISDINYQYNRWKKKLAVILGITVLDNNSSRVVRS